jgi:hypothetical protein
MNTFTNDDIHTLFIVPKFGVEDINETPHVYIDDEYETSGYSDFADYCVTQLNELSQRRIMEEWNYIMPIIYTFPNTEHFVIIIHDSCSLKPISVTFCEKHFSSDITNNTKLIIDRETIKVTSISELYNE